MIRILLVDDCNILRQGIQALLEPKPKLKIVGTAENGHSAIEQVKVHLPDIVLMDIEMPVMSGITATHKICQQFPKTKVLVLSSHEDSKYVAEALLAGASGYLLKNTLAEDLEQAIWSVYRGRLQIEAKLFREVLAEASLQEVTMTAVTKKSIAEPIQKTSPKLDSDRQSSKNGLSSNKSETIIKPIEQSRYDKQFVDKNKETATKKPLVRQDAIASKAKSPPTGISKSLKWWIGLLIAIPILSLLAITLVRSFNPPKPTVTSATVVTTPEIKKVAALGRIEPLGEIMSLSAPTSLEAVQVEQLLVEVGDRIKKRQIIAILDGRQRQQATLDEAKTKSSVASARLEKVRAGAKQGTIGAKQAAIANLEAELAGEIETQQATIARLSAELDNARIEFERNQQLHNKGAISASELDSKKLNLKTTQEQLNEAIATKKRTQSTLNARLAEARATLEETAEIRPVDIQIAEAELRQAQAAVARAQADMELAYVRAPMDGEILDIHTRPGEALNEKGIAEIGQTRQMMVVAEIDQNDISKVKIGQKAAINSGVFPEELQGKVHQVGSLIGKKDILDTDPAADEDGRVIEVEILLEPEDSQKVVKLSNLEVDVIIEI